MGWLAMPTAVCVTVKLSVSSVKAFFSQFDTMPFSSTTKHADGVIIVVVVVVVVAAAAAAAATTTTPTTTTTAVAATTITAATAAAAATIVVVVVAAATPVLPPYFNLRSRHSPGPPQPSLPVLSFHVPEQQRHWVLVTSLLNALSFLSSLRSVLSPEERHVHTNGCI